MLKHLVFVGVLLEGEDEGWWRRERLHGQAKMVEMEHIEYHKIAEDESEGKR